MKPPARGEQIGASGTLGSPPHAEACFKVLIPQAVSLDAIRSRIAASGPAGRLRAYLAEMEAGEACRVISAAGSAPAFLVAALREQVGALFVAVLPEHEAAAYLASDLEQIRGDDGDILMLPPSGRRPFDPQHVPDSGPLIQRADAIERLSSGFDGILVTSAEALAERVPAVESVQSETLTVVAGQSISIDELLTRVTTQGFELVEFVEMPGEVAIRGGILDIFPFAGEWPVRLEFFGDEVDSIREFDPQTQRSISRRSHARLVPDLGVSKGSTSPLVPLFDHIPDDAVGMVFDDGRFAGVVEGIVSEARRAREAAKDEALPNVEDLYVEPASTSLRLGAYRRLLVGSFSSSADREVSLGADPQPPFNSDIGRLRTHLRDLKARGFDAYVLCDSPSQRSRMRELLADPDEEPDAVLLVESLHQGFVIPDARLAVFTDHEIFNRYHRPTARKRRKAVGGLSLRDLQGLTPGDFVVHVDHGIGRFAGLHKIRVRDAVQEAVRLEFSGGDELFVNVGALHKLHKYTGKEGHQPRLTKLGSGQWERVKSRTKKRVKDIARDLIALYARRKASTGYTFSDDTTWQREMEASFRYEDTPDQAAAAEQVKADMRESTPMDRLVCGDVGFGKTEIAVRAAFKAVQDGKQVAVLVPTTLLAMQHHATFTERLERYPVRIAQLSRLVPPAEQTTVRKQLAAGEVDIVIGTQRLAGKNVRFEDLGLLIIDEEQRFGVAAKERLRRLRTNVDTLTLTATPIPRTLQFSLLGVRDLSIISTPPPNRQPVQTEIHAFDRDLVRDAILYEVTRGGQVFFVHNRVQTIEEMAAMLRALVPDVRIRVAHGQMKASELEDVMRGFLGRQFDVLVSTNIVESGLDVPNANTMIINHAERFGLADLHQLRGRVGRSDVKAFCYLLVPSIHTLTRDARMRLQAVEQFSELGSGFALAMRDLDIRGAGAMLGAEQSGFIEDLGYEVYHRILEEAVQELRRDEYGDLFGDVKPPADAIVDVDVDILIPETYVTNGTERMNLYRRLADMGGAQLDQLRKELEDRFGPVPAQVDALLDAIRMKPLAEALRLSRVAYKNRRLFLTFPDPETDPGFYEGPFAEVLARLEGLDQRFVLKEGKNKRLRAIVQEVGDLQTALAILHALQPADAVAA